MKKIHPLLLLALTLLVGFNKLHGQADVYHYTGNIATNSEELYDTHLSLSGNEQISCGRTVLPGTLDADAIVVEVNKCDEKFTRRFTTNTPPGSPQLDEFVAMIPIPFSGQYAVIGTSLPVPLFSGPADLIFAILNPDGSLATGTTIDINPGLSEYGRDVLIDAAGDFYLVGMAYGSTSNSHFVIKLDPGLNVIWASLIDGPLYNATDCRGIITSSGRLFVTGTLEQSGSYYPYVAELDMTTGALANQVVFSYPTVAPINQALAHGIEEDLGTNKLAILGYRYDVNEEVWVVEMDPSLSPPFDGISVGHGTREDLPEDISYNETLQEIVAVGSSYDFTMASTLAFFTRLSFVSGPTFISTLYYPGANPTNLTVFLCVERDPLNDGFLMAGAQLPVSSNSDYWMVGANFLGEVNCGEYYQDWGQLVELWEEVPLSVTVNPTSINYPLDLVEVPSPLTSTRICSNCVTPKTNLLNKSEITASPNPASDYIHFSLPDGWSGSSATILDAQGKAVLNLSISDLELDADISHLTAGIYLATFTQTSGKTATIKFVVE